MIIMRGLKAVLFFCYLFPAYATGPCEEVFSDPDSFYEAMTKQLVLKEGQEPLFKLYFINKTPYQRDTDYSLQDVLNILNQYPELSKLIVREQILEFTVTKKETPNSLKDFISSFRNESSRLRNSLFQVEANLGFWAKTLGFSKIEDSSLSKEEKKALRKKRNKDLTAYLDSTALNKKLRDFIKDDSKPYRERTVALYKALEKIRHSLETAGADSSTKDIIQNISQVMAVLIHTAGFGNKTWVELLKSKDPHESLNALRSILNEQDILAFELGFTGHFAELKAHFKAKIPDKTKYLTQITEEIQNQPDTAVRGAEVLRLRPLSIQESPFRSCLSGDCATDTYFETALDPNFLYFTLTNSRHESSGHVTLALGEAQTPKGLTVKTAFVDKIQDIEPQKLKAVLQGISVSLKEQGYILALPKDVGDLNGLSNEASVRDYVGREILPDLSKNLNDFKLHEHKYKDLLYAETGYSRAYSRLQLLKFEAVPLGGVKISPGEIPALRKAHPELSILSLYEPVLLLEKSTKDEDQIQFLNNLLTMRQIKELNLSDQYVDNHLNFVMQNKNFSFKVRKKAFYILIEYSLIEYSLIEYSLTIEPPQKTTRHISFLEEKTSLFSEKEKEALIGEMSNWKNAVGYRKEFITKLTDNEITSAQDLSQFKQILDSPWNQILDPRVMWTYLIYNKQDINFLTLLLDRGTYIDYKDETGRTVLMVATMLGHIETVRILINRGADINAKDEQGKTALMKAAIAGRIETVRLLINEGADINAKDKSGRTALMEAASEGHIETIRLLINEGADINAKDKSGRTALMEAAIAGHIETVRLLIDEGADTEAKDQWGARADIL